MFNLLPGFWGGAAPANTICECPLVLDRVPLGNDSSNHLEGERSEIPKPSATWSKGWWRTMMRRIISDRRRAVSLA